MTVTETAQHFQVDPATVRRWIEAGCPCVRKGMPGPGRGAQLDLDAVRAWRGMGEAIEPDPKQTLERIASALRQALIEDRADLRADVSREDAAAVLLVTWDRVCNTFGTRYAFDQQPDGIRALMREL